MANEQNLIPANKRSKEEHREIAKKGGIKSGEVRRERKKLKDELLLLLSNGDIQAEMCLAIIKQATEGNTKAFEIIRDTIGEKPVDNINADITVDRAEKALTIEELKQLAKDNPL